MGQYGIAVGEPVLDLPLLAPLAVARAVAQRSHRKRVSSRLVEDANGAIDLLIADHDWTLEVRRILP